MSLLAMGILEKERDFLLSAIGYNTQNGAPTNHLENKLIKTNEAIEELEQYEQNFKDKEFKYRTKCQNIVSAGRVEADNTPDRLAELEKVILDYYLAKEYVVGNWYFNVATSTYLKFKVLKVFFNNKEVFETVQYTAKETFDEAIKHFSLKAEPMKEDTKLEVDDTNQSAIYKIAGYESDGRE